MLRKLIVVQRHTASVKNMDSGLGFKSWLYHYQRSDLGPTYLTSVNYNFLI